MEQYEIAPAVFLKTLRDALRRYKPEHIFVREVGSAGGKTMVRTDLRGKTLAARNVPRGIAFRIDGKEIFFWKTKRTGITGKNWAIAYERRGEDGRYHFAPGPYENPDDPSLPRITKTLLRAVNSRYFAEITFDGKIPVVKDGRRSPNRHHLFWFWKLKP